MRVVSNPIVSVLVALAVSLSFFTEDASELEAMERMMLEERLPAWKQDALERGLFSKIAKHVSKQGKKAVKAGAPAALDAFLG